MKEKETRKGVQTRHGDFLPNLITTSYKSARECESENGVALGSLHSIAV